MDKLICFVAGAVLATAACVIGFGTWRKPDKALVLTCRERVGRYLALSEADRTAWDNYVLENPTAYTRWRATCVLNNAFGGVTVKVP